MEVADRTEADKKGGHLARRKRDRRLLLREVAQTPAEDLPSFQDIRRHRYFNTNNIWIDLRELRRLLDRSGGIFRLPLIRNRKTIDPRDSASPSVVQLETAMGAAIELFDGARGLRVPRTRFAPVKLCSDLLVLGSDAYRLDEECRVVPTVPRPPVVHLDPRFYKKVDDMKRRFPEGFPSLRECEELTVEGDVTFGRGVVARGKVKVSAREAGRVSDGRLLEGEVLI
jgi:UTP--glucose-1-phosphate uridylyltransferase